MVCIKKDPWVSCETKQEWRGFGPRFNEVVTIEGECPDYPDSWLLKEHQYTPEGRRASFKKHHFAPLMGISELLGILYEPITESV